MGLIAVSGWAILIGSDIVERHMGEESLLNLLQPSLLLPLTFLTEKHYII